MNKIEARIEESTRQQRALADLSDRALGGADLTALMRMITEMVSKILQIEFCEVLELLPGDQGLVLRAGVGWRDALIGRATVPPGMNSQAGYTLLSDEPIIVDDLQTESRFNPPSLLRDHAIVSGITLVIGRKNQPFGVLGAHSSVARAFSKDDLYFLQ